ncbi:MAG TPA: DNA polymerase III subunit delta' [Betaproteobacteria bacterium]|nr:DNA polymerase III subunit delta' [Betaproteobacteria bacterium]
MEIYPWHNSIGMRLLENKSHLPHALLLSGRKGIGKRDFGLVLAQSLLCQAPVENGVACNRCSSCNWFQQGNHPDFRLLEPDSGGEMNEPDAEAKGKHPAGAKKPSAFITVSMIRALLDFTHLSTYAANMRIVLIHPAEAMNPQAANSLLKTLEEPIPDTLFILISHQQHQLLPTIRSRCHSIAMPLPSRSEAKEWLQRQQVDHPDSLLAQAGFAPLAAARLAEREYQARRHAFLSRVLQEKPLNPLALSSDYEKIDLSWIINWLQTIAYDLLSIKLTGKSRYLADCALDLPECAKRVNLMKLIDFQNELAVIQRHVNHPLNTRLVLEQLFLSYLEVGIGHQAASHG